MRLITLGLFVKETLIKVTKLSDDELPVYFINADKASMDAQKKTLLLNRLRLIGAIAAAFGGAFSLMAWKVDLWAVVSLLGFLAALSAEIFITHGRHERDWYQARAGAESVKTLSWRYAVGADPFFLNLSPQGSETLFRERVSQVMGQISETVPPPSGDGSAPTLQMQALRNSSITIRRGVYIRDRTHKQREWYTDKALQNKNASITWQSLLLIFEVVAVVLAAGRVFGKWDIDFAGIIAAFIGAGAAWLALKQHTTLRAAYALTAAELQKQSVSLQSVSDEDWPKSVADAEEAISREHTMWLASRGEVNETIG